MRTRRSRPSSTVRWVVEEEDDEDTGVGPSSVGGRDDSDKWVVPTHNVRARETDLGLYAVSSAMHVSPTRPRRQLQEQLPQMVQGVFSDSVDAQLECTTKFRKLLSKERNPPIEKVIECGVVARFVEFLRSPHSMIQVRWQCFSDTSQRSRLALPLCNNTQSPASPSDRSILESFFLGPPSRRVTHPGLSLLT